MAVLANAPDGYLVRNVFAAGGYIPGDNLAFSTSTVAISANVLYCLPFTLNVDIDALAIAVTTGSAGAARMGIYACGVDGEPTTLIEEAAVLDTTSIATVAGALAGVRRLNQPVWVVLVSDATPTLASANGVITLANRGFGTTSITTSTARYGFTVAFTYAALPAVFPAGAKTAMTSSASVPSLAVRIA